MTGADYLLLILLLVWAVAAVRFLHKNRGCCKSACGGDCAVCKNRCKKNRE